MSPTIIQPNPLNNITAIFAITTSTLQNDLMDCQLKKYYQLYLLQTW